MAIHNGFVYCASTTRKITFTDNNPNEACTVKLSLSGQSFNLSKSYWDSLNFVISSIYDSANNSIAIPFEISFPANTDSIDNAIIKFPQKNYFSIIKPMTLDFVTNDAKTIGYNSNTNAYEKLMATNNNLNFYCNGITIKSQASDIYITRLDDGSFRITFKNRIDDIVKGGSWKDLILVKVN